MDNLGIYLTWGKPGTGKSLDMARTAFLLLKDYEFLQEKYPDLPHRRMFSNMKFSKDFEEGKVNKYLFYWTSPRELTSVRNCDILWDEIGRDLPPDGWRDTAKEIRQIFSHYRKRGNRIFANTQDYKAIDINFRRMVSHAYKIRKAFGSRDISATFPQIKPKWWLLGATVWGRIVKEEYPPDYIEKMGAVNVSLSAQQEEEGDPHIIRTEKFWITRKLVDLYDTAAELPPYRPNELLHRDLYCKTCGLHKPEHEKL